LQTVRGPRRESLGEEHGGEEALVGVGGLPVDAASLEDDGLGDGSGRVEGEALEVAPEPGRVAAGFDGRVRRPGSTAGASRVTTWSM
jgi:hypothetical protein